MKQNELENMTQEEADEMWTCEVCGQEFVVEVDLLAHQFNSSCERDLQVTQFIIELESGVWRADWPGDPGRTLVKENAKRYSTRRGAAIALGKARKFRPFKNAVITAV